jgi:hypothetical protein
MKIVFVALVVLLMTGEALSLLTIDKKTPRLHRALSDRSKRANLEDDKLIVWIYFVDKPLVNVEDLDNHQTTHLSERAILRRRKMMQYVHIHVFNPCYKQIEFKCVHFAELIDVDSCSNMQDADEANNINVYDVKDLPIPEIWKNTVLQACSLTGSIFASFRLLHCFCRIIIVNCYLQDNVRSE